MKILLVDDEPFALSVLAQQLANLAFTDVRKCVRAHDALALLESQEGGAVELLFCDLQMPEMDGVELLGQLARIAYRGKLVLISGEDGRILQSVEKLARAYKLDVLGALHKPVSPERLKTLLAAPGKHITVAPRAIPEKRYTPERLRQAIICGELVNHYQPKVNFVTGALIGVETLVRWQHPQDGLVYPDSFIGIAEQNGLIDDLTELVLRAALRQAGSWHAKQWPLHLAVNISMDNLNSPGFTDLVSREARAAGLPLSHLMLELTESCLTNDRLATLNSLTRLRLKGVGLSIDDFGTGHSSLAQLRDIPFTELKIDRSFVHGAAADIYLRPILEGSLEMARSLGMESVAEGVEDLDDWNFMAASSCNVAQGYFIGRPMGAADLPAWWNAWKARSDVRQGD